MNVTVCSFGFKYGVPIDADMIFDVRFLPNPFYVDKYKYLDRTCKRSGGLHWKCAGDPGILDKLLI